MSEEQTNHSIPTPGDDDARLQAMLRAMDADAASVDPQFVANLRQRTLETFADEANVRAVSTSEITPVAKRPNWLRRWGALAAVAATVAVCAIFFTRNPVSGAPQFSQVLDDLRHAKTLELKVTKDGHSANVWVQAPGLVRWEDTPQKYRIASGSRLWQVDETNNSAVAGDSPWFLNPHEQVDLLGLLEVGVSDASPLLAARANDRAEYANQPCYVYRVQLPSHSGPLNVEAYVDTQLNRLLGIVARPQGAPTVGPPLAELQLVAINGTVDESKFVVAKTLTEDGRIGKIIDSQGLVVLRPMLAQRWTPISSETMLKTGDWLRTDIRGANAVKIRLSSEVELTLGPGSLLELISSTQARLHTGEVQYNFEQLAGQKKDAFVFELLGPQKESRKLGDGGKQIWRVDREEKLAQEKERPQWLAGFEGASSNESLGSLIVNLPDGRNEPLEVGYHKVSVEIRDQIARTTIEESFVNHTQGRLEGVFYSPLPQDASISDFGMWIGNELVEADIVEKQRAREIYETILREKRDPGLLEWTSGNLFKARVFPIEAQAEKRIKIVYTQVLPLRGNQYRYTYGLRSELLASHPLRELNLSVQINSALPLKSVKCPTHSVRTEQTEHSAQVDFAAQDYTPSRDFEVVCEVESRNSDVVVIPHRRGDDGYFLLQLTPPGPEGNFQRELIADGKPVQLVLLCDTSASMDREKRKQQSEFVAAMLASLGEKDKFQLAAADVATEWASSEAMSPTAENIAKVRKFLEERTSLGWTDLEQAFAAVLKQAPADAQIVYIGDGIVTAGETDPASFVKRLGRMITAGPGDVSAKPQADGSDKPQADNSTSKRSFHAVTVGNTYEAIVLSGIAEVGHGSVRNIGGERTPQLVALELLNELTQPGLRDVKVEFRDVQVAAVYPEQLPSLPAGTQQILVGRYLPTGAEQQGEVVVTARRGEETVHYAAKINLKDAEEGNSFIPRLWARQQLDHLLEQGPSAAIKGQIIGLSEEFHIITPYTSLLVLESDADRERFGVKKRFTMRDGERFFAKGRDNANFELLQQQMKQAGDWRLRLRYQVLRELAGLGRNPQMLQQQMQMLENTNRAYVGGQAITASGALRIRGLNSYFGVTTISGGSLMLDGAEQAGVPQFAVASPVSGVYASGGIGGGGGGGGFNDDESEAVDIQNKGLFYNGVSFGPSSPAAGDKLDFNGDVEGLTWNVNGPESGKDVDDGQFDREDSASSGLQAGFELSKSEAIDEPLEIGAPVTAPTPLFGHAVYGGRRMAGEDSRGLASDELSFLGAPPAEAFYETKNRDVCYTIAKPVYASDGFSRFGKLVYRPDYTNWMDTLFPALTPPPGKPAVEKESAGWTAETITLSKSLLRTEALSKLNGGIEIVRTVDSLDPRWKRRTGQTRDLTLYAPTAWLMRPLDPNGHIVVDYCDAKERLVFSQALLLGRTRKSTDREWKTLPIGWGDHSLTALHTEYSGDNVQTKIEPAGEHQVKLTIAFQGTKDERRFLIDTNRHVLLKEEQFSDGKPTCAFEFSDFVEVAGCWWPRDIATIDSKGQKITETKLEVKTIASEAYSARIQVELASKPQVQFLTVPGVSLKVARQRAADGSAGFDDRITLILQACLLQQWDELFTQLDAAEKLAADKSGVRWVRTVILSTIRRNDEARKRLLEEAHTLAAKQQPNDVFLADFVLNQAGTVTSPAELLEFVRLLEPVYTRQAEHPELEAGWQERLLGCYEGLQRVEEALALRRTLAEQAPWDVNRQIEYARKLLQAGHSDAAYEWVQKELDRPIAWTDGEDESLRSALAEFYRTEVRWKDLLQYTSGWIQRNPPYGRAYQEHLSALVYNNQLDAVETLVKKWLKEAQVNEKLQPDLAARVDTAISFTQGNCWNLQIDENQIGMLWSGPLTEAVEFFARHKEHFDLAQRIMNDWRFSQFDGCDRLRGEMLGWLQTDLDQLSPEQISAFVGWSLSGRLQLPEPLAGRTQLDSAEIPSSVWQTIAEQLHRRWLQTEDKDQRNSLSEALRNIYANRFDDTELLPFLRERISLAAKQFKTAYIAALFDALIGRKWSEANEREAFELLQQLSDAEDASVRLVVEVPALLRLVDGMIAGRQAADEQTLHDAGKTDQLTRIELRQKIIGFAKAAKIALAAKLATEVSAIENTNPSDAHTAALLPWLRIEQAYLDVQLGQNLPQVEEQCWKILGEAPPKQDNATETNDADEPADTAVSQIRQEMLDAVLRQRAFITVMNLSARRTAKPETIERTLKYIDAGIDQHGPLLPVWRAMKFQLLTALDRPDDLEQQLRGWIRSDETTTPWRKALALLLAERGKLDEAIQLFEAAAKYKILSGPDYRTLANWYLVKKQRQDYERCRIEAYKRTPEQFLSNLLWQVQNRWMRNDLPPLSELDDNTLFALRALLEKTSQPGNYFWVINQLYRSTRDFRVLQAVPDGVLGRSPEQIYPYLQTVEAQLLREVQQEATNDEIISRIKQLREQKLTETDQRALDLLEAMVERRSAEVLNQPGPHSEACVAALKRAFDRQWAEGEPLLMAGLLNSLGKLPQPAMIDEQLRELRALRSQALVGGRDHLLITNHLCNLLFWSYDKHDEAIQEMQAEARSYDQTHKHAWPEQDNNVLGDYVHLYEGAQRYAEGEKVLQQYLAKPDNDGQHTWLQGRLLDLYNNALDHDGEVSLGKGQSLFDNLLAAELSQLQTGSDENVRCDVVSKICSTFSIAKQHQLANVKENSVKFAFEIMPVLLPRQQSRYHDTATVPLGTLREVLGSREELRYLVERMEQYPQWLSIGYNNVWNAFSWELAQRRQEIGDTGELEPRILKFVIAELQRDLRSRQARSRVIYSMNNQPYFWTEKTDDFARAAEAVYEESKNSGRGVEYVANYLWNDLHRFSRAIEMLLIAYRQGLLDEGMQEQLADYLQQQQRFAESISILEPLIEQHADNMQYRHQLMVAYFHSQRPEQLNELVKHTDEHFHEGGHWNEGNIADFGQACVECQLYEQAAGYLNEAISLHQRAHGGVTLNDQWLSDRYQQLADAQSSLGHTKEAVDAASGAIVCWGNRQDKRGEALGKLRDVLSHAKDLSAYVEQLDQETAKSGQDSPILRKALGQVLQSHEQWEQAIKQFQLAVQLQPNDREVYEGLIACYDKQGKPTEATKQLLLLIGTDPHNFQLYEQLANRLKEQPTEAERAITSMVEVGVQEAENHAALATYRQQQNRWDEAITQWADVAKLRALEPTGLIKLAEAQVHQKQWAAARETIEKLHHTQWPARFNDVNNEIRPLENQLPKK